MIFGFGKGKIDIVIERYNFSPGETIKGNIILKLKEPTHAKALKVGLLGEKSVTETRMINGRTTTNNRNVTVFNFEMPLDGEKDYTEGEYDFELKVPTNLAQPSLPQSAVGDVIKTIQILAGRESNVRWYVVAKLDIPMGIDVSKKIQINIG
jgi:sporulation-control protein spo0M